MPPVKSAVSSAIQGVADASMLLVNANERDALLELLTTEPVPECSNSTLAIMPLCEPPPAAFLHMTDTSEIHLELEHDVAPNRTDNVADRCEKYRPTISIQAMPVVAGSETFVGLICGSGYETRSSIPEDWPLACTLTV
jgi:hypothetical protein